MTDSATVSFSEIRAPQLCSTIAAQGYARITSAFNAIELKSISEAVDELIANPPDAPNMTWHSDAGNGETVVQRISRANLYSTCIAREFMAAKQLQDVGSWVFNVPRQRVRIADGTEGSDGIVLVIKHPRNQSVHRDLRWHCDDKFTKHLSINPFVNCGLYLDRSDEIRGGVIVLPPAHVPPKVDWFDETIKELPGQVILSANPGDLMIHRADVWHRSGPHFVKGEVRRVIYANLYVR